MKRYFLIITLLSFMFLGLGNLSFGQSSTLGQGAPGQGTPINVPSNGSNIYNTSNSTTPSPTAPQVDTTTMTQGGGSVDTTTALIACNPLKNNAHLNVASACVCNDGYKDVNGTCTSCKAPGVCCGISLNTSVPFIGNCIEDNSANQGPGETNVTGETAFPVLISSLTKILVTAILIISFVLIIIGGIMISTGNPSGGKSMIIKVVVGIALLGASGVILRLINPNFFG